MPFTEALSAADYEPKKREIFIFSLDGENFDTICLGERKKRVVTFKYSVSFSDFIPINPPLPIKQVQEKLNKVLRSHFIRVSTGDGARVPPKTWEALISYIKKTRPTISKKIDELYTRQNIRQYSGNDRKIESFKRDAATVALKIAGIDSKKADFDCYDQDGNPVKELPAFLSGLENYRLMEDRMIIHDSKNVPEWTSINVPAHITARFTDGSKVLTIQNFNREDVETALGVDLMYFNEFYRSFVLIQYKAFNTEGSAKVYRLSDSSYKEEYENMKNLQQHLDKTQNENRQMNNYRFHRGVCYFKLCDRDLLDLNSTEMIKGMYIPLDYWADLVNDDSTKGKRGGRFVSYDNVGRYFNNTQFIELVKEGWIGTTINQSKQLEEIISEILSSGRSVILADYKDLNKRI